VNPETIRLEHPQFKGLVRDVVPVNVLLREFSPRILPPGWRGPFSERGSIDGLYWTYEPAFGRRLKVILSAAREDDSKLWLHVSVSKWNQAGTIQRLPDWEDLKTIKQLFIGEGREAYMVLPKASNYVNLGEVHHLWVCLDGEVLPDFTSGTGSI